MPTFAERAAPTLPRLALTAGEPAGVGAELIVRLAASDISADLVAITDPTLLEHAARTLGVPLVLEAWKPQVRSAARAAHTLRVVPIPLAAPVVPGQLDVCNASHVLTALARAADGAANGEFDALVTAPVHKGIINDAGIAFTGHTEFFAARASCEVVMMLAAERADAAPLRVALATTHLPLSAVPTAITRASLTRTLRILDRDLRTRFALPAPHIGVLGLNPHAGESGHMGREEIEVIAPVIDVLRGEGMHLDGPLPADTAFVPHRLAHLDAVLAMYHDQGLPVLKYAGFGHAVNVTLGLPYVRTSVDHGTALDLAGSGRADPGSLLAATRLALELAARRQPTINA
ncbi:4-hydroxythreonine-4-phosphate dehydrogenase PdxA [Dokdonella sp.]|uniref:4-hydroxythreonine-4-phosphate dehydrogenase PdxA n=1 Tax=Dokdonella sp. TaxID=2291710 RepID=UPI0025C2AD15|nr:4-hydroxythreonine-4-phosphate dehydrogenase PdxA [Dokdonella sp.]MBX3688406.1 4-hydroxythreonine-4-phosphate dehydrogenase PdxA [Dokdonella sp.]